MTWNDDARYMIIDDVPWDQYEANNFPPNKVLLTCNEDTNVRLVRLRKFRRVDLIFAFKKKATDKFEPTQPITVRMPAIVLLNREDAGSLLAKPGDAKYNNDKADYWATRAEIIEIGKQQNLTRKHLTLTCTKEDSLFCYPLLSLGEDEYFTKPKEIKPFDESDPMNDSIDDIEEFRKANAKWLSAQIEATTRAQSMRTPISLSSSSCQCSQTTSVIETQSSMETDHAQTMESKLQDESREMPSEEIAMEDADVTEKHLLPTALTINDITMKPIVSFLEAITVHYDIVTRMETILSTAEKKALVIDMLDLELD
jgi:hypothetical protein